MKLIALECQLCKQIFPASPDQKPEYCDDCLAYFKSKEKELDSAMAKECRMQCSVENIKDSNPIFYYSLKQVISKSIS